MAIIFESTVLNGFFITLWFMIKLHGLANISYNNSATCKCLHLSLMCADWTFLPSLIHFFIFGVIIGYFTHANETSLKMAEVKPLYEDITSISENIITAHILSQMSMCCKAALGSASILWKYQSLSPQKNAHRNLAIKPAVKNSVTLLCHNCPKPSPPEPSISSVLPRV